MSWNFIAGLAIIVLAGIFAFILRSKGYRLLKKSTKPSVQIPAPPSPEQKKLQAVSDFYGSFIGDLKILIHTAKAIRSHDESIKESAERIEIDIAEFRAITEGLPQQLNEQRATLSKMLKEIHERLNQKPKVEKTKKRRRRDA